jgi:hypothetical protein
MTTAEAHHLLHAERIVPERSIRSAIRWIDHHFNSPALIPKEGYKIRKDKAAAARFEM